ncbi:MAG: HAD-IA family hydrolase [Burkholderiales bacterium]|nr:MAG: HAD-IA family hydrolase [Burkholderiales bacterium]
MTKYELVVFDWDGTLFDSTAAIAAAIRAAAQDLGLAVPDERRAAHVIGLGLHDALRHAVPDLDPARVPDFVARYRSHYFGRDEELTLFEGVETMLHGLQQRGLWLGIATGKSRAGLNRVLQRSGLGALFHATRCADEGIPKPHPWMLLDLCEELRVAPERTLMVGDTTHDRDMASSAGADFVAVAYGAHAADDLAEGSLACLHQVAELRAWLDRHVTGEPA